MADQHDDGSLKEIRQPARTSNIALLVVFLLAGVLIGALGMRSVHERTPESIPDDPEPGPVYVPSPGRPENLIPGIVRPHLVSIYARTEFHKTMWRNETIELSGAGFLIETGQDLERAWILTTPEVIGLNLMAGVGKNQAPRLASYEIGISGEPPYSLSNIERLLVHRTRPAVLLAAESVGGRRGGLSLPDGEMLTGETLYAAYQPEGLPIEVRPGMVTAVNKERSEFRYVAAIDPGRSGGPLVMFENGSLRVVGIIHATSAGGEAVHAASKIHALMDFSEYEEVQIGDVEDIRRVVEKLWFGD